MESLHKIEGKINSRTLTFILMCLVFISASLGSFALGRISAQRGGETPPSQVRGVFVDTSASDVYFEAEEVRTTAPKPIVASVNGTRYYPEGCKAGNNINPENKIWFTTENEAKMAGYTLSKSCD